MTLKVPLKNRSLKAALSQSKFTECEIGDVYLCQPNVFAKGIQMPHQKFAIIIHVDSEHIHTCLTTSKNYDYLHVCKAGCRVESKEERRARRDSKKMGTPIKTKRDCYLIESKTSEFNHNSYLQFDNVKTIDRSSFTSYKSSDAMKRVNYLDDSQTLEILRCMNRSKQITNVFKKKIRDKEKKIVERLYKKKPFSKADEIIS